MFFGKNSIEACFWVCSLMIYFTWLIDSSDVDKAEQGSLTGFLNLNETGQTISGQFSELVLGRQVEFLAFWRFVMLINCYGNVRASALVIIESDLELHIIFTSTLISCLQDGLQTWTFKEKLENRCGLWGKTIVISFTSIKVNGPLELPLKNDSV